MTHLVCDASVLFKLFVPEEDSDRARSIAESFTLIAPELAFAEIGNALWTRHRRGEFTAESSQRLASRIQTSAIESQPVRPLLPHALALATEIGHPIYDCVYLALAASLDLPLITADNRFLNALREVEFRRVDVRLLSSFA
jgi:predicted nucleic acid-binding protein